MIYTPRKPFFFLRLIASMQLMSGLTVSKNATSRHIIYVPGKKLEQHINNTPGKLFPGV
jgi:hypothetical protein